MLVAPGATSLSLIIEIVDDSGLPVTGLVSATFPTTKYVRAGSAAAAITTSDLGAANSAYSSGGVFEIGSGRYRLDLPDAAIATACHSIEIFGEASGKRIVAPQIDCQNPVSSLTTAERNSIADAYLDRADAVEVGLTPRQSMRLVAAANAGKISGAGTVTITFRNAVADSKNRIVATVDSNGNRSAISYDVS
jgi:hypothetical protein